MGDFMREEISAREDAKLTRATLALITWSVIFYTAVCTYYVYSRKTFGTSMDSIGLLAISIAVFIPLMGVAYGIMAGILKNGRGWMLCFADGAFSAILVCLLWDGDEIYGRLGVCLFVGAAVFSFTSIVKSLTEFAIFLKRRR